MLVTGAGGMVGQAVVAHCAALGDQVAAHDHSSLDITDSRALSETFARERPETVINCAAWTDVDGCELDAERAYSVNAEGPRVLAAEARRCRASLVTISTDYVFDGEKQGFYTQRDDPNPQSVYGAAKLEGERRAQAESARTVIVRTGWIFGVGGRNFLSRVIELAASGVHLSAIKDAYGTPTYAQDLAARLRLLAERDLPGIYHVTNSGEGTSYEEFTRAALAESGHRADIEVISMDSLKRPAPRPRNARLRCLVSEAMGLEPLPFWLDSLKDFVTSPPESASRAEAQKRPARLV
ncbi:MAG TPA: dTDP-4-dehydrorhamnose reductase [Pyrinomonadaceae bacterium]